MLFATRVFRSQAPWRVNLQVFSPSGDFFVMIRKIMNKLWKPAVEIMIIAVLILLALWSSKVAVENEFVRFFAHEFGYLGIFVASVANALNPIVQIPMVAFLPLLTNLGLDKWMIIGAITFAVFIVDVAVFILVKLGGKYVHGKRFKDKDPGMKNFYKDSGWIPSFVLFFYEAAVPLPNELIIIPMAFKGYRLIPLMPAMLLGNLVFNILAAEGFIAISKFL